MTFPVQTQDKLVIFYGLQFQGLGVPCPIKLDSRCSFLIRSSTPDYKNCLHLLVQHARFSFPSSLFLRTTTVLWPCRSMNLSQNSGDAIRCTCHLLRSFSTSSNQNTKALTQSKVSVDMNASKMNSMAISFLQLGDYGSAVLVLKSALGGIKLNLHNVEAGYRQEQPGRSNTVISSCVRALNPRKMDCSSSDVFESHQP